MFMLPFMVNKDVYIYTNVVIEGRRP